MKRVNLEDNFFERFNCVYKNCEIKFRTFADPAACCDYLICIYSHNGTKKFIKESFDAYVDEYAAFNKLACMCEEMKKEAMAEIDKGVLIVTEEPKPEPEEPSELESYVSIGGQKFKDDLEALKYFVAKGVKA